MPRTGRPRAFEDEKVVDDARDVFWQRGYGATSMRDLGQSVGLLPGSLYGAFGDKHTLFLRALERYVADGRQAAASLCEVPVVPRLREFLTDVLRAARIAPGRGCMLGNTAVELAPQDSDVALVVRRAQRELENTIQQALELAQHAKEIHEDIDCGAQARLLVALMQGLHVLARAETDPLRLQDAIDVALAPLSRAPRSRSELL